MGTRADFYVGRGKTAVWLGSVAWDGYEVGNEIPFAKTEIDYRAAVEKLLAERDDATLPVDGWPWPWKNSSLTDYAYAFDDGVVYRTEYPVRDDEHTDELVGYEKSWVAHLKTGGWAEVEPPYIQTVGSGFCEQNALDFPDMSKIQNVTLGGRSGVMLIKVPK